MPPRRKLTSSPLEIDPTLIEQLKDFIRDVGSPVEERITIEIEEVKASMDQEFSILKNEIDKLEAKAVL
jgi:CO dehydrogenase/acetyl-CoA synthase beta subunit